jgi:hypothetical protein
VIDYRMQQYRVFPYLAAAYALKFTGRYMRKLFDGLAQVHHCPTPALFASNGPLTVVVLA